MVAVRVNRACGVRLRIPFPPLRVWPLLLLLFFPQIAFPQQEDLATLQRRLQELDDKYQKEIAELKAQIESLQKKEPQRDEGIEELKDRVEKTEADTAKLLGTNLGDKLSLYGYWDSVLGWNRYESETWAADQYHMQTFFSYKLEDNVRVLTDVTYEHGPQHTGKNLGDLKVRSFAECAFSDKFKLNFGKFLTPFGEYNLYHDAVVVYTSANAPRSLYWKRTVGFDAAGKKVEDRLFAKEAAGIWFWGNLNLPNDYGLEYNVYGTNGRGGGNIFQVDDNNNKGIGGKLVLSTPSGLKIGASHYRDRNGNVVGEPLNLTTSFQAAYTSGPFTFGGEYMRGSLPGTHANAYYLQGEYEVGKFIPYYRFDSYSDSGVLNPDERIHTLGLNYAFSSDLRLKTEYGFYRGAEDVFQSSLAAAF